MKKEILTALYLFGMFFSRAQYTAKEMRGCDILRAYSELPAEGTRIVNELSQPCLLSAISPMGIYFVFTPNINTSPAQHVDACTHDSAWTTAFIQMIEQSSCPTGLNVDTLNAYLTEHDYQLYTGVSTLPDMPEYANVHVKNIIGAGFMEMSLSDNLTNVITEIGNHSNPSRRVVPTTLDSIKVVVDYVYTKYTYSQHTQVSSSNIDSLADLLETGNLAGDCGNITRYLDMIITEYFPWWGTGVELNSNSSTFLTNTSCEVSHVFLGLADSTGKINYILDATINGVWCDSLTGKALSLDTAKVLLMDSNQAYRVVKRHSIIFGDKNSGIGDLATPCVIGLEYPSTAGVTGRGVAPADTFWVISPWLASQFDAAGPTRKYSYYWNQLGLPTNNWANNLLIIYEAACYTRSIGALVQQRYGFSVNEP